VFKSKTHHFQDHALKYVEGLFKSPKGRATCYFMGHTLEGNDGQHLNHLLTQSPWDHFKLFELIQRRSTQLLRKHKQPTYLLIDEVGFRKKGTSSACVAKQYLGSIGASDNGQVAVSAAVSASTFYCPLDIKLFMPQHWETDLDRRLKTAIPPSEKHHSKTEMAQQMILRLYKKLHRPKYVVFDSLYGANVDLLYNLMQEKIPFVGGTKKSYRIYLKKPQWILPSKKGITGPKFFRKKPDQNSLQLQDYLKTLTRKNFKWIKLRQGTKGYIHAHFHLTKVWVLHKLTNTFLPLQLLVRKDLDGVIYYSLCFSNSNATLKQLARAQGQRVFVERIFEEGKNILGMGDYQTRSWKGFHRHMALCSLSLLFLMEQKILLGLSIGRVTAYQIHELIMASINSLSSMDLIIQKLTKQIPKYQNQILNQLKIVT